jgi:hypothetical protein
MAAAAFVAGIFVAASGLAAARIGSDSAVEARFYACVARTTGGIRVVGRSTPCRFSERRIWWNQVGPAGQDGVSGYQVVQRLTTVPAQPVCPPNALCALKTVTERISCPTGKRPIGGGYDGQTNSTEVRLLGSHPTGTAESTPAWVVSMYNPGIKDATGANDASAYVYAVCVTSR